VEEGGDADCVISIAAFFFLLENLQSLAVLMILRFGFSTGLLI